MYDVEIRRKRVAPMELVQAKPIASPALPHRASDRPPLCGENMLSTLRPFDSRLFDSQPLTPDPSTLYQIVFNTPITGSAIDDITCRFSCSERSDTTKTRNLSASNPAISYPSMAVW